MSACIHCGSQLNEGATVCAACGEWSVGKRCEDCWTMVPQEARRCRWCGFTFETALARLDFKAFAVSAGMLPSLLIRGRFLPQRMLLDQDKIIIRTPGSFGLTSREEEIPWKKVAGFDYRSGILWDTIRIETRGQSSSVISCLSKGNGARIREVLQALEE